jgi:hypothetical protein
MTPDLTDDDKAILAELLKETIERDRFPLSPRIKRLRGIPFSAVAVTGNHAWIPPMSPRPVAIL